MYRVYQLTDEEKDKIVRCRWDGDTHYYDVFESQEECDEEQKRLDEIETEYRKEKADYLKKLQMRVIKMFKYIISYDGGQLRDSGDFEWGLFNSYGEAEETANDAKEEYMNDWDIKGSEYNPDDFCIEIEEV